MIDISIAAFVRVEQLAASDATYYDMVEGRSSLTKGGMIRLLTQDIRCLPC